MWAVILLWLHLGEHQGEAARIKQNFRDPWSAVGSSAGINKPKEVPKDSHMEKSLKNLVIPLSLPWATLQEK